MNTTPSSSSSFDSNSPFVDLPFGEDEETARVSTDQGNGYSAYQDAGSGSAYLPKTKPKPFAKAAPQTPQKPTKGKVAAEQADATKPKLADAKANTSDKPTVRTSWLRRNFSRDLIAFFSSLIFHTGLLICMMVFIVAVDRVGISGIVTMSASMDTQGDDSTYDLDVSTSSKSDDLSALDNQKPMASSVPSTEITTANSVPTQSGASEIRFDSTVVSSAPGALALDTLGSDSANSFFVPTGEVFGGFSLEGRSTGNRSGLALANGGSTQTEAAVEAAILWLVKHQFKDGSWSTVQNHPDCMDKCRNGSRDLQPKAVAATGLALLAMLGAGYTHREGPYRDEVYRALQFLLNAMQNADPTTEDPRFPGQFVMTSHDMMYEQGIATFALCEAYHMTKDKWLERGCQLAVNYVRSVQSYDGSWGYYPGESGDLSIVGWQMMALRSAAASGLSISTNNIRRVDNFLNGRSIDRGETYFYRRPGPGVPEMTAIGALMRLMRGWSATDPKILKNIDFVYYRNPDIDADDGPELTDVYFNYYATNLLFYSKSNLWPIWNERMKQIYLATQSKEGHEAGSWFAYNPKLEGDGFTSRESDRGLNMIGGRLYTTTMAALTLEVYYRILPLQHDDVKIDFQL